MKQISNTQTKPIDMTRISGSATALYDEMVKRLTPVMIQDAAKYYFNTNNYDRFVLLPETTAPAK